MEENQSSGGIKGIFHEVPTWGWWVMAGATAIVVVLKLRSSKAPANPSTISPVTPTTSLTDSTGSATQSGTGSTIIQNPPSNNPVTVNITEIPGPVTQHPPNPNVTDQWIPVPNQKGIYFNPATGAFKIIRVIGQNVVTSITSPQQAANSNAASNLDGTFNNKINPILAPIPDNTGLTHIPVDSLHNSEYMFTHQFPNGAHGLPYKRNEGGMPKGY